MIIFFSGDGGARTDIPETEFLKPAVMLSWHVNAPNNKPDSRFRALMRAREWQNNQGSKMKLFFSGYSHGKSLPEQALVDTNKGKGPCIMLTHHEIHNKISDTVNRFRRHEERRLGVEPSAKDKERPPERIWLHFLDSGAHSIYMSEVVKGRLKKSFTEEELKRLAGYTSGQRSALKREMPHLFKVDREEAYKFYKTRKFWERVDLYAQFLKDHPKGFDFYANLDVIYNPELTWKVQRYLEDHHGLNPVPVIHHDTPIEWVKHYLREGYEFIGLGGIGQETELEKYYEWADAVFKLICPGPKFLPKVRTHGFAMTSYDLLMRYPWWSVDSASWVKAGGYGLIYVPHKRGGRFVFDVKPYSIAASTMSKATSVRGRHINTIPREEKKIVHEWLEMIGVPIGTVDEEGEMEEWGVVSHHGARKINNLRFFKLMEESLPKYPWPYICKRKHKRRGIFETI